MPLGCLGTRVTQRLTPTCTYIPQMPNYFVEAAPQLRHSVRCSPRPRTCVVGPLSGRVDLEDQTESLARMIAPPIWLGRWAGADAQGMYPAGLQHCALRKEQRLVESHVLVPSTCIKLKVLGPSIQLAFFRGPNCRQTPSWRGGHCKG